MMKICRTINFYCLYKKILYFVNSAISFVDYQFDWSFISVTVLWLIHGFVFKRSSIRAILNIAFQLEFQKVFWGLFVFIMLVIMVCSVYKRVTPPTKRHYDRYVHFCLKMNDGIYQENEKLRSTSELKIWMFLVIFIYIPFIIANIDALHF